MEPNIIDIYTSSRSDASDRKNYFYPGDSLQFNCIHNTLDGFLDGAEYSILWNLEFFDNAYTFEDTGVAGGDFEVIHRPIINASGTFRYRFRATHNFWCFDAIPTLPTDPPPLTGPKASIMERIVSGAAGQQIFFPGIWRMNVVIRMLLDDLNMQLACKAGWCYGISRSSRLI